MQDTGKFEWKNDDKDKTEWKGGSSYQKGTSSYLGRCNSYSRGGFHGNCFRCGKEGHIYFECRSSTSGKGNNNAFSQGDIEGSSSGYEAGENLMVGRTLCNKGSDEEPILRRSLFKTRCKMDGKCCKVIIDSGISTNLASEELVTKLQLQRLKHPKPYHVSWIKDEHKILVSEQCIVKFKIGHYFDEVLCDIMPKDCCYILLARPWKYDIYVVHDGRLNQYTLWVNGKKQILLPLIESPYEVNYTTIKVCMVNGKKIEKEVNKNQVYFSIISRGPSVGSNDQAAEAGNDRVTTETGNVD